MKVYSNIVDYGAKTVIGYRCDNCSEFSAGESMDDNWLDLNPEHYCLDCQVSCALCGDVYSVKYMRDWFKNGVCERCE